MNRIMRRIFIYILPLIVLLDSCSYLELAPKDFISPSEYYKTEEELETALTGIYASLRDGALYKNYMLGRMGLDADQGYDNRDGDIGTVSQYQTSASDAKVEKFWQACYKAINNANLLIWAINNNDIDVEDSVKNRIKGEASFLRGYFYLLLVSNFGDVPLVLESSSSPYLEDLNLPRTPSLKVYEQIIEDMTFAVNNVMDITEIKGGGRVSKSAAYGMLARVHLYMAGEPLNEVSHYADARTCALKVMNMSIHSLNPDFQQVFKNYAQDVYDIKESIFEVEFYGNGSGIYATLGGYVGGNNGIRNTTEANGIGYTYDYINATKSAYEVYAEGDLRRDYTIAPFKYNWSTGSDKVYWAADHIFDRNCGKFRREYETLEPKHRSYTPTNFPLLRYSDVLLMFAEADNEVGKAPSAEAYEAVNQVVRRGYGKDQYVPDASVDWAGMDYETFRQEIQNERSRELAYECLRKADLVRWGIFYEKMKDCLDDANAAPSFSDLKHAKLTFGNVTERDVVWPIPSYEIALIDKLTQNKGW